MVPTPVAAPGLEVVDVVVMLAGGNLPPIGTHSAAPAALHRLQLIDSLAWASRVPTGEVLLVRAAWDRVVPPPATDALWEAFGQPPVKVYPSGNYSFALFLPLTLDQAVSRARARCPASTP
jgi:hypothetical protein